MKIAPVVIITSWTKIITLFLMLLLSMAACSKKTNQVDIPPENFPTVTLPFGTLQQTAAVPTSEITGNPVLVAYITDGNLYVWDSRTQLSETIFSSGDVTAVTVSYDGQVIAFLRTTLVGGMDGHLQSALWAVDRDGGNPRELVPAERIRQRFKPREVETAVVAQMEWIPGSHRLLYSGWTYYHRGEGESHATSRGLYLVDADTLKETELVPVGDGLRFVPSPDGGQIAILFLDRFGFISPDGSLYRPDVLSFPAWQSTAPIFPTGAWTRDNRAFVLVAPIESKEKFTWHFTIWYVPVESADVRSLATVADPIYPGSISLSPGGSQAAYFSNGMSNQPASNQSSIVNLSEEVGPLAGSPTYWHLWAKLNWSPSGTAYSITEEGLVQLCTNSTDSSDLCCDPLNLGGEISAILWLDNSRYLFLNRETSILFIGGLDGVQLPIASVPQVSEFSPPRFSAVVISP